MRKLKILPALLVCLVVSPMAALAWTDGLELPTHVGANMLMNGGFEQGLKGWKWVWTPSYERILELGEDSLVDLVCESDGNHAISFKDSTRKIPYGVISAPMDLSTGLVHTISFRARANGSGKPVISFGVNPAAKKGTIVYPDGNKGPKKVVLDDRWRRYSRPFVPGGGGAVVWLTAGGAALVDDVQVACGEETRYRPDPVEGRLVGNRGDRKLLLCGTDGLTGEVAVSVRDYFAKTVRSFACPFELKDRETEIPLGDDGLGDGLFIVRLDYRLADGRSWTDYTRLVNLVPLDGTHPTYPFFGEFYQWHLNTQKGEDMLKFRRDYGIGGMSWLRNEFARGKVESLRRKYGVKNVVHVIGSELPRDFFKGVTNSVPEKLAHVERVAYEAGLRCPEDDVYWALYNEEELALPIIRDRQDFDTWFQYQYAGWKGLKRAFDERGLKLMYAPTHGTCQYAGSIHRKIIGGYLAAAKKRGFMYDFISVHMYWSLDGGLFGGQDRAKGAETLFAQLKQFGYSSTTPIVYPEGFNILPVSIPQWGAVDWGDAYGSTSPSYDMGRREWLHAAAHARLWIMDLKSWPRLMMSHTWQQGPIDADLTPWAWCFVPNTLGRLLPSPVYCGSARPTLDVRGYCFRQGEGYVMAVWTSDREVEAGMSAAPKLTVDWPSDARFVDLMCNPCGFSVSPAPVFVLSKDGDGLLKALREATSDRPRKSEIYACRPMAKGGLEVFETVSGRHAVAQRTDGRQPMTMYGFHNRTSLGKFWFNADWFHVPHVEADVIDWKTVPALPLSNVLGGGGVSADLKMAWSEKGLSLLVSVRGAKSPGLYLSLDGLGDGHRTDVWGLDPDDSTYDFVGNRMRRLRAINTQYAVDTTNAVTDDEMQRGFPRRWIPSEDGGAWEIRFPPRYLVADALKPGAVSALNLAVRADGAAPYESDGVALSSDAAHIAAESPQYWPFVILD